MGLGCVVGGYLVRLRVEGAVGGFVGEGEQLGLLESHLDGVELGLLIVADSWKAQAPQVALDVGG